MTASHLCPACGGTGATPDPENLGLPKGCEICGGDGLADNAAGKKVRSVREKNHPEEGS